jgi:hypothetical protein
VEGILFAQLVFILLPFSALFLQVEKLERYFWVNAQRNFGIMHPEIKYPKITPQGSFFSLPTDLAQLAQPPLLPHSVLGSICRLVYCLQILSPSIRQ